MVCLTKFSAPKKAEVEAEEEEVEVKTPKKRKAKSHTSAPAKKKLKVDVCFSISLHFIYFQKRMKKWMKSSPLSISHANISFVENVLWTGILLLPLFSFL